MVSISQIRQFKKDYNNLFLDTERGNPMPSVRRIRRIKSLIWFGIYIAIVISINILADFYNINIPTSWIGTFDFFYFIIPIGFYLFRKKILQKDVLLENEILSDKLKEFVYRMQQIGLNISSDIASEEQAGEKIAPLNPSQKFNSTSYGYGNYSNSSRFIQNINKRLYYIQLSNGLKIDSSPRTPEQERYAEFLQSVKTIEDDLFGKINHYFKWAIIILLITSATTIPLLIIFQDLWMVILFFGGFIVFLIYIRLYSSASKIYIRALIIQNKLPLKKIKIGADSNPTKIYSKIRLGKTHEKRLEKYNERIKNQPKGIKKVINYILVILLLIGALALAGLLIYGIIWLVGHSFTF